MGFTSPLARRFAATATAAVLVATFSVTSATAQERLRRGVPIAFGSNLTALSDTLPWVAERLRAMSGGRIDLRVQEPGTVIPPLGVFDAVSEGKVDAGYSLRGLRDRQGPGLRPVRGHPLRHGSARILRLVLVPRRQGPARADRCAAQRGADLLRRDQPRRSWLVAPGDPLARPGARPALPRCWPGRADLRAGEGLRAADPRA